MGISDAARARSDAAARSVTPASSPLEALARRRAGNGYGIWTADGKFLKFDAPGSEKALAMLQASEKKDHLRVDVEGTIEGETLKVASIAWAK